MNKTDRLLAIVLDLQLPAHFDLREYTPLDDRHLRECLRFNHDICR